jgi:hypothetical protein
MSPRTGLSVEQGEAGQPLAPSEEMSPRAWLSVEQGEAGQPLAPQMSPRTWLSVDRIPIAPADPLWEAWQSVSIMVRAEVSNLAGVSKIMAPLPSHISGIDFLLRCNAQLKVPDGVDFDIINEDGCHVTVDDSPLQGMSEGATKHFTIIMHPPRH